MANQQTVTIVKSVSQNRANIVGVQSAYDGHEVIRFEAVSNGPATAYLVPANKRFLLCNVNVSFYTQLSNVARTFYAIMYNSTPSEVYRFYYSDYHRYYDARTYPFNFNPPIEMDAGMYITIYTSAADIVATISIHGYEMEL